ncbi:F-box/kelch-repeat protein SKIP25 [Linum perenne]
MELKWERASLMRAANQGGGKDVLYTELWKLCAGPVVVVVDVVKRPSRIWVVKLPDGFEAVAVHVLPRMSQPEVSVSVTATPTNGKGNPQIRETDSKSQFRETPKSGNRLPRLPTPTSPTSPDSTIQFVALCRVLRGLSAAAVNPLLPPLWGSCTDVGVAHLVTSMGDQVRVAMVDGGADQKRPAKGP